MSLMMALVIFLHGRANGLAVQDLLDLSKGSPRQSPLASPTSRGHGGNTPRVATQLNWFRGNSISCLNGSPSAIRLRKVAPPVFFGPYELQPFLFSAFASFCCPPHKRKDSVLLFVFLPMKLGGAVLHSSLYAPVLILVYIL